MSALVYLNMLEFTFLLLFCYQVILFSNLHAENLRIIYIYTYLLKNQNKKTPYLRRRGSPSNMVLFQKQFGVNEMDYCGHHAYGSGAK